MRLLLLNNILALQRAATGRTGYGISPCGEPVGLVRCWQSLIQQKGQSTPLGPVRALNTCGGLIVAQQPPATPIFYQRRYKSSSKTPLSSKTVELGNINPGFITMQYAVRGPVPLRAAEIQKEMAKGIKKNFTEMIFANLGDAHALAQKPLTFFRQFLALCVDPTLFDSPKYPNDVKERAKAFLAACQGGSIGSYTASNGIELVREQIAKFIERRDGVPSHSDWIYTHNGATSAIKCIMQLLCCAEGKKSGIMTPVPQFPLYSVCCAEYGLHQIDYYLDEDNMWSLDVCELQRAYDEAKSKCNPRAIVVINPGNPTGSVLKCPNIIEIVKFAHKNRLMILADEVYQTNIYAQDFAFHSFKKMAHEMGEPYKDMELISFHSGSKGAYCECGTRGGYMELVNIDKDVRLMLNKYMTTNLNSNIAGQALLSCMATEPQPGEPSYDQFEEERTKTFCSLKERAELVYEAFNSYEGFKVNKIMGALYVLPKIDIPPKAIEAAKAKKMVPDVFYCFELLESAGIVVVPGSGFGQQPGTHHFRTTILPQLEDLKAMLEKFNKFQEAFMKKYK